MRRRPTLLLLLAPLAACGVSYRLQADVPAPATVAVLPFTGQAPAPLRDATRALLLSRLQQLGYRVAEIPWVDRVLSERGWLADPATFDVQRLPLGEVAQALHVDAVAVGTDVEESSFNLLVLRRHHVGGRFELCVRDGRVWWQAEHSVSDTGGFLLKSGQVLTELGAQLQHGSVMASLGMIDELTADLVTTVPPAAAGERDEPAPVVSRASLTSTASGTGRVRWAVEAEATAGSSLWFELRPHAGPVPMTPDPTRPTRFRGAHDLPADASAVHLRVIARAAFGQSAVLEVEP